MALLRSNDPVPMGLLDRSGVDSPGFAIISEDMERKFFVISYCSQSRRTPYVYSNVAMPIRQ